MKITPALLLAGIILSAPVLPPAQAQNATTTIPVFTQSNGLAINPITNKIYAITGFSGAAVIDGVTRAVNTVTVADVPGRFAYSIGMAINPVTNKIYFTCGSGSGIPGPFFTTVLDSATLTTTTLSDVAGNTVVNPVTNKLYAANLISSGVVVIDGATNATTTIAAPANSTGQAGAIAVNAVTNKVYVSYSSGLYEIDGVTNATTAIFSGGRYGSLFINPGANKLYAYAADSGSYLMFDCATGATTAIPLSSQATAVPPGNQVSLRFQLNPVANKIYIANYYGRTVTVIDWATTAATTFPVQAMPTTMAVNPVTNQVYVLMEHDATVLLIDGATNARTIIPIGPEAVALAINPVTNKVYVADNDGITVIDGDRVSPPVAPTRLINLSARARVGTGGSILIPGLVIGGSGTETLLIRGAGPSLTAFGVAGVLAQPSLSVINGAGTLVASNQGWSTATNAGQLSSTATQVGAFPFAAGSADCAVLATLAPGSYTVQISGVNQTTGVALAEVYEVASTGAHLANLSARAQVGTGGDILITGFVVAGAGGKKLLLRGVGPALTPFGVTAVLAQPSLSVWNSSGQSIASNTGWATHWDPTLIAGFASAVGAFPLVAGGASFTSADSAQVVTLPAGTYTLQVSGVNATSGNALAEVYEVP